MNILEGFRKNDTPDLKYYAFDWDDNIVHMPTQIILKNDMGEEVGMGTDDFAEYREIIGEKIFKYEGNNIIGYSTNPFRNFRVQGDQQFLIDARNAELGPSFNDFREAINNGSVFAIITARGHHPNTIKMAIKNYIYSNFNGIDKNKLIKNLKKYRNFVNEKDMSNKDLIDSYLELNRYYPVTFGDTYSAISPEEAKVTAMKEFISYVKAIASLLQSRATIYNKIANKFNVQIGFSDDDEKNIQTMKSKLDKEDNVKLYLTKGGNKKLYNNENYFSLVNSILC